MNKATKRKALKQATKDQVSNLKADINCCYTSEDDEFELAYCDASRGLYKASLVAVRLKAKAMRSKLK